MTMRARPGEHHGLWHLVAQDPADELREDLGGVGVAANPGRGCQPIAVGGAQAGERHEPEDPCNRGPPWPEQGHGRDGGTDGTPRRSET